MVNSEHGTTSDSCELAPECTSLEQEELQVLQPEQGGKIRKKVCFVLFFNNNRMCERQYKSCLFSRWAAFLANLNDQVAE